uniref:Uncharacterized protein n=1 Tax=Rhizophora mucronata TaxID=61149 RepID=A0A2P2N3Y2_RHIMU
MGSLGGKKWFIHALLCNFFLLFVSSLFFFFFWLLGKFERNDGKFESLSGKMVYLHIIVKF